MAKGIAHRDWSVQRSDYETDQDFNVAVQQEMALGQHIMDRLGVAIVSAPVRRRYPGGGWYTEAVIFKTATVPGVRADEPEPEIDLERALGEEPALVEDPDPLAHVE
jgi:hypothetical protein